MLAERYAFDPTSSFLATTRTSWKLINPFKTGMCHFILPHSFKFSCLSRFAAPLFSANIPRPNANLNIPK